MKTTTLRLLSTAAFLAASSAVATAAPPDDTLVVGISADANTFDPAQISSRDNSNIAEHIFQRLYRPDPNGKFEPEFATSYSVSADGTEYTYKVKAGEKCEDGEALTADDVAYSFNRAADPANKFTGNTPGYVFDAVQFKKAEAVDDTDVKVTIGHANPIAFELMNEVYIHCKDSYEKLSLDDAASHPVASGPYKLVSWDRGSQITLEKWKDPGTFNKLIWRIIPEASTRSAELIAGNVDIITNVAPDQMDAINNSGDAAVKSVAGTRRIYVGFNFGKDFASTPGGAAIQKTEVRQALQYAVDVPTICKQLLNFECTRANGLVNPPANNQSLEPYPYDPDKAEKMLDEAGYPKGADGVRFKIVMQGPNGRYLNDVNVEQAIGQYLTDIGVETEVQPMEWASVYVPLIQKHQAGPLFFLGSGGVLGSAIEDMTDLSTPEAGTNYTNWSNPEWFKGWATINAAKSEAEARPTIDEMLKVFYNDPPWLMLYFQPGFYGVSKRVDYEPRRDELMFLFNTKLTK